MQLILMFLITPIILIGGILLIGYTALYLASKFN